MNVAIARQEIFGAADEKCMPRNLPADSATIFAGYVGSQCSPGAGLLILGINPGGGGDAYAARTEEDQVFHPLLAAFATRHSGAFAMKRRHQISRIVCMATAGIALAGCSLVSPPPAFVPQETASSQVESARARASEALVRCVTLYAEENSNAPASATEIADGAVSHCWTETQAMDIANREDLRLAFRRRREELGPERSARKEFEEHVEKLHADMINAAHGAALERVIALRGMKAGESR